MIVDAGYGWSTFLYTMAASYLVGGICWPFINSDDRLKPEPQTH